MPAPPHGGAVSLVAPLAKPLAHLLSFLPRHAAPLLEILDQLGLLVRICRKELVEALADLSLSRGVELTKAARSATLSVIYSHFP